MTRKKLSKACPHVNGEKKVLQSNSIRKDKYRYPSIIMYKKHIKINEKK